MKAISKLHMAAGAALILIAAPAVAQDNVVEGVEQVTEKAEDVQQQADDLTNDLTDDREVARERDDDDGFDWGLLGLLGLAGLLGLRKRDNHGDIHVDARDNTRA